MQQLRALVIKWGSNIDPRLLVYILVALNVYWTVTLGAFDRQFRMPQLTFGSFALLWVYLHLYAPYPSSHTMFTGGSRGASARR